VAAIIILDDGRALYGSSFGVDGMLFLISAEVKETHASLKRWLADVGKRPSPCQDFDVRGFTDADRAEFWRAAAAAADNLRARFGDGFAENRASPSSTAIARLLELRHEIDTDADADMFYPFDGRRIDLSDVWERSD
jgi:hypothetical protein